MCTKLNKIIRDGFSTCSICGGKDAYGKSSQRTEEYKKKLVSHYGNGRDTKLTFDRDTVRSTGERQSP